MTNSDYLVTVIVPCYNYGHFLSETLSSVAAQSHTNFECIIINDGSTDNSIEVAEKWCGKDSRFQLVNQDNQGLSSARNKGIDLSKGDFIQFLDADDFIYPEKLAVQINDCLENHSDISICDYIKSSNDNLFQQVPERLHRVLLNPKAPFLDLLFNWEINLSVPCHCFLFRRIIFSNKIRFDADLTNHEDIALWLKIFSENPRFSTINSPLAVYRTTKGGMTKNIKKMRSGYTNALTKLNIPQLSDKRVQKLIRRKVNLINYKVAFESKSIARIFYYIQKITGSSIINWFLYRTLPEEIR